MGKRRRGFGLWAIAVAALAATGLIVTIAAPEGTASAALSGMPAGFVDEVVVDGLPYPTAIAFAPDDTMFVALKAGVVRVHRNGQLLSTPFIDISDVVHDNHDRGLLGITVHPEFPLEPYLYLLYTHDPDGVYPDDVDPDTSGPTSTPARTAQLMRVEADPATEYFTAKAGTETILLGAGGTRDRIGSENDGRDISSATCMSPKSASGTPVRDCIPSDEDSHTIGSVAFGPDGSLFVSSGDGSNYTTVDPRALRAQNLDSLAGKILRIDPATGEGLADNPFFEPSDPDSNRSKVWARGLRNPFRFAVNPTNGEPYVGDVGWNNWEEINSGKGANFGWPCYEGGTADPGENESGETTSLEQYSYLSSSRTSAQCAGLYAQGSGAVRAPVYTYNHTAGQGRATTGGAFYTGTTYPSEYRDAMFIADYNDRWIRYLTFDAQGRATRANFGTDPSSGPVQLITGPDTNLYWMRYDDTGGEVRRIRYVGAGNTPPVVEISATPRIGIAPLTVEFNSDQSYDSDAQPLEYVWDFGDGATSTEQNPSHIYTASGVFDAELTITEQTAPFAVATKSVRITVGNNPPLVTIEQPSQGDTYRVGDTIEYSATALAGGTPLPAESMEWQQQNHHNQHVHYATLPSEADPNDSNRSQGSFEADDHGDNVFYEICVTATVSDGVTDNQCVEMQPEKVQYTFLTEPVGLRLAYEDEGIALSSPAIIEPVVGSEQTVSVQPVQEHLSFVEWSDGSTNRSKTFTVGDTPQAFTAIYENQVPTAVVDPAAPAGQAPYSVTFDGTGSSDPEGDLLNYEWSTSDGRTATGANPSWTFETPGTYTVTLTVTDQLGETDSTSVTVQATEEQLPPTASFTLSPASGRSPLTISLDGRSSSDPEGGALTYEWLASTGQTSTGAQTSLTLSEVGPATITLTVTDQEGSSGSTSRTVTVEPPAPEGLVAAFGFDESSGSSVLDSSGSGNNGTASGASRSGSGRFGGALSFDGVNDSVSVADAPSLDLTDDLTLSAWVRPTGATSWRTVLLKERPGGMAYGLYASSAQPRPSGWLQVGGGEQQLLSPSALPADEWSHLAFTYDGSLMRMFLNGVEVADQPVSGNVATSSGALKIGGNAVWGEWFSGLIDEVRLYDRALTASEMLSDMANPIRPDDPDTEAPSVPGGLSASGEIGEVSLEWTASTDDVGVAGYEVHRSTSSGFTLDGSTLLTTVTGTSHVDGAVTMGTEYFYRVVAKDAAGNASAASDEVSATPVGDTEAPAVSVSAPEAGSTVSNSVQLTAIASDDVGVVGVRFRVDGVDVGAEDTSAPFGVSWNSASVPNGAHDVTAVARDAAGNVTESVAVSITVENTAPDTEAPAVSVSAPEAGSTVSNSVQLTAIASDDVGVVGVRFRVDGVDVGAEDTSAPFGVSWNSASVPNGAHDVTAVARDAAGNVTESEVVLVNVDNVAPEGLVAAFGFDESSGSSVLDSSGSGNNGTASGASRSGSGRFGGALSFDGVNDSVSVADAPSLDLTDDLTLSAWVRPTGATSWRTVLLKERPGGMAYGLYASSAQPRPSGWLQVGGGEQQLLSPSALPADEWSHLAFTYDGSLMRMFLNGVEVADQPVSGNVATSSGALKIGGNAVWGEWFSGLIDEVRLYDRALTASEMLSDMANPIRPDDPDTEAPSVPGGLSASGEIGEVSLEWTASTDDVGVAGYEVHRSTSSGFTLDGSTLLTTVTGTSHVDGAVTMGTEYFYRVVAKDAAGNASAASDEVSATPVGDTEAPAVSVSAPEAGSTVSNSVQLTAIASDDVGVVGVRFRVDGVDVGAEDTSAPFGVSWNSASVPNGAHDVTAVARDAAGNVTESVAVSITVENTAPDTEAPAVSVSAPEAGSTVSNSVQLTAIASDDVGVVGVRFRVDGVDVGAEDTSAPFGVSWNSASVPNGAHDVTAVARDAAGNVTESVAVSITVENTAPDTEAPAVSVSAPEAGSTVSNSVQLTAIASDDVGVVGVRFRVDGVDVGAEDTSAPFGVSWNSASVPNGAHDVTAVARDAAGNVTESVAVSITVENTAPDTEAPAVSVSAPEAGSTVSNSVQLTAIASDDVGVVGVRFRVDGVDVGAEDTSAPFGVSWNSASVPNGAHDVTAVARDAAGNVTESEVVLVNVDNVAPEGLVAAFGFDESSGSSVLDSSGSGNNGTASGASRSGSGRFGGALSFDGVNDSVSVADAPSLDLTDDLTLSAWVRPTGATSWRTVLLKERPGGMAYGLYASSAQPRPSGWLQVGGGEQQLLSPSALPADEWSHLAFTYDGSFTRMFLNGVEVADQPVSGNVATSSGALKIGGNAVWGEWFSGLIDEVRLYDRALTASEMLSDMLLPVNPT